MKFFWKKWSKFFNNVQRRDIFCLGKFFFKNFLLPEMMYFRQILEIFEKIENFWKLQCPLLSFDDIPIIKNFPKNFHIIKKWNKTRCAFFYNITFYISQNFIIILFLISGLFRISESTLDFPILTCQIRFKLHFVF